jgi:hypothetical protein
MSDEPVLLSTGNTLKEKLLPDIVKDSPTVSVPPMVAFNLKCDGIIIGIF